MPKYKVGPVLPPVKLPLFDWLVTSFYHNALNTKQVFTVALFIIISPVKCNRKKETA